MDTINVAALFVVLSGLIAKVVERIRARFPRVDGDLVALTASIVGGLLAWSIDLRGAGDLAASAGLELGAIPVWLDYALTGIGLGLGAGVVNDLTTRNRTITVEGALGRHEELPPEDLTGH